MTAFARSPLRSLRSLHGERATPLRVNSKPDTLCALKPDKLCALYTTPNRGHSNHSPEVSTKSGALQHSPEVSTKPGALHLKIRSLR